MLVLIWTVQFLFTSTNTPRRHAAQRWCGIDRLTRVVAAIVVLRAVQLCPIRRRARRASDRFNTRAGFKRRTAPAVKTRAILGARMRKHFYARDPFRRIGLLLNVLRNLDAFALRIGARGLRGLSRLRAITATRPAHDAAPASLAQSVACADSS